MKSRRDESPVRNTVSAVTVVCLFVAVAAEGGLWIAVSAVAVLLALWWAVSFGKPTPLFATGRPDAWPVGARWRSFAVVDVEPLFDDCWIVMGRRLW